MTHICVGKLTIIASDNGLSPNRRQAIIRTNAGILLIEPLGTNFYEILIEIHIFSFKKMHWKMSSGKWRPFCLGLNVLNQDCFIDPATIVRSQKTYYEIKTQYVRRNDVSSKERPWHAHVACGTISTTVRHLGLCHFHATQARPGPSCVLFPVLTSITGLLWNVTNYSDTMWLVQDLLHRNSTGLAWVPFYHSRF